MTSHPAPNRDRYAVIGNPIGHSRSPQIHAWFAHVTGEPIEYRRIQALPEAFAATVQTFFAAGGKGMNVTVPFKTDAWALAKNHLTPRARIAGAVNTLWQHNGHYHGCNTDGVGLVRDLQRWGAPLSDARILLLGAGGAARGVLSPLLAAGCASLMIANRTAERAQALLADLRPHIDTRRLHAAGLADTAHPEGWDLVINATASSLHGEAPALPRAGVITANTWAYDMMYGAQPTPFLTLAASQGARTQDGLGMLIEQAAESFYLWRGVMPPTDGLHRRMRHAIQQGCDSDTDLTTFAEA